MDNINEIKDFCEEIEHYTEYWKTRVQNSPYIDAKQIIKKSAYVSFYTRQDMKLQQAITKTENKIESWTEFSKKLHEPLKNYIVRGLAVNHPLHARIDPNLRIIYIWQPDEKILIYHSIIKHDDLKTKGNPEIEV